MDKIYLGKYNIATKWEDITLLQWSNYVRTTQQYKEENKEMDIITTLEHFSNIPREVIYQIPTDLFERLLNNLKFIDEEPRIEPSNKVTINNEVYAINTMYKLKVKEYMDLNTILENDKYNYPVIFAILCRKQDEEYDENFISDVMEKRIQMFENISVIEGMKLIAFFLDLYKTYAIHLQSSLMVQDLKQTLLELVRKEKNLLKPMDYITPSKVPQIMTLRKLEKSLKNL